MLQKMEYTSTYNSLKSQFALLADEIRFTGSNISCRTFSFTSDGSNQFLSAYQGSPSDNDPFLLPDERVFENQSFTYPVFLPGSKAKYSRAIILLHGLNERNWTKYLSWAYCLAEETGSPVILFPIAFHMNRSPQSWSNPRLMSNLLTQRANQLGDVPMASFANLALSNRLTDNPQRFATSGRQSAEDLEKLVRQIVYGNHPLFEKGTGIDLFAYSIGAFLAQIIMLSNPGGYFTDSRLFMFCGGAFFDQMDGTSKLIMDKNAFDSLRNYYINDLGTNADPYPGFAEYLKNSRLGVAFTAMLASKKLKSFRESVFEKLKNQISAIVLKNDKVIPAYGTIEAMKSGIEVMDFPFDYSHEVPFPVGEQGIIEKVDAAFNSVFKKATDFLR
jgi:hypothetical protein